jgi:hypothetical protein
MEIFLLLVLLVSVNEEKGKEEGKNMHGGGTASLRIIITLFSLAHTTHSLTQDDTTSLKQ